MATLQPFPKFRAFDANGNPLTGGKVWTYAAGTTTPLVTYTDSSGSPSSENTNPVTLDANGEADIWYGDNLYKLVLFSSTGVLQWEIDNIGSGSSSSVTNGGFGQATDIASSALVDLGSISTHFANITGTTTINNFGTSALTTAPIYLVKFESVLTLTQSASLLLPGSADILVAQNDRALLEYLGSGVWRVFSYMRADGSALVVNPLAASIRNNGYRTATGNETNHGAFWINTATDATMVLNRLYAIPFFIGQQNTFNRIGINVTTTNASNVRFGIYNVANGVPTTLVADLGAGALTTGAFYMAISQNLAPNLYALAAVFSTAPVVKGPPVTAGVVSSAGDVNTALLAHVLGSTSSTAATYNFGWFTSLTYGVLPATFGTATFDTSGVVPALTMRNV